MKQLFIITICSIFFSCTASKSTVVDDEKAIRAVLTQQKEAWSNNDLEGFMQGYWNSSELTFFSGGKITKGWQTTLANYQRNYPTKNDTGTLDFEIATISKIDADSYWVMGSYFLTREAGNANGTFMIIFKRIDGQWKIIADSSC